MPNPSPVVVRRAKLSLPTYSPAAPDKNPMFLEKRVYQGSSGCVYPLPFYDRVSETPEDRDWEAVYVSNEYLEVLLLPELGGRIHRIVDKASGEDLIYHQTSIKPALVGLAGPWVSGGIEFNWPQHHRPSTFMPADPEIVEEPDGSVTVWLSEHDPLARMKGMHGVCLHPGRAVLELKVRAYNRTPEVQTFLWWANLAARVHEEYQSFFPPDARMVADHAKRASSSFPECRGTYYGVDYAARAQEGVPPGETPRYYKPPGTYPANDLSWYANIPVPTSYMCLHTEEDFFGGYDHRLKLGIVHVADRHIAPGKKQWTWGNHDFGYAWDRNLTVPDEHGEHRPYIELMAGVFTDNQPDFSFLQPGETKSWSQYWYPIRGIGPAQQANLHAALSLQVKEGMLHLGACVTRSLPGCRITLRRRKVPVFSVEVDLRPESAWTSLQPLGARGADTDFSLELRDSSGGLIIQYQTAPKQAPTAQELDALVAQEMPAPADIASSDELYLAGLHLEQYRHATRKPEEYWREACRRDPGDSRANLALGRWHLRRAEFSEAERCLRRSLERLTRRNPNPYDGETLYQLGRCLRFVGREEDAYEAFAKAAWNQAWAGASLHALAELSCARGNWELALGQLNKALALNEENLRGRDLKVIVLRKLGRVDEALTLLKATRALDPLDWWARWLEGQALSCDTQVRFDLALDLARAGLREEALLVLKDARPEPGSGTAPMLGYYRAWLCLELGRTAEACRHAAKARAANPDYCFPFRLEEHQILREMLRLDAEDSRAALYLGHWLYSHRRHAEALTCWETCVRREPGNAVAWRNLGIGYFNVHGQASKACRSYERAVAAAPRDARVLYERDQLWKRTGVSPARRLRVLKGRADLVACRDDLSLELISLYNQTGASDKALELLMSRRFQPWEGGEGQVLREYVRTQLLLAAKALASGQPDKALVAAKAALAVPESLGEAVHLLANRADVFFCLGEAEYAKGRLEQAREHWEQAARGTGDFRDMRVQAYSELSYYAALALSRLGRKQEARRILSGLLSYAEKLEKQPAVIDYFATSLPDMLLFDDDLQARQITKAQVLRAQALLGLGRRVPARRLLRSLAKKDPNHPVVADLLNQADVSL